MRADPLVLRRSGIGLVLLCACALAGCGGGGGGGDLPEVERRLQTLASMFSRYASNPKNKGKLPPDEKALKAFIKSLPPQELTAMKLNDVDALFISPRDEQPFVVVYQQTPPPVPSGAPVHVVAYERQGVGGKRYVAFATGQLEEVDAERAQTLNLR
jgi:hypothetical protein